MNVGVISLLLVAIWRVSGMMSFRLSSEAAGSGFPEKSSGDADNATDPKSPRDTPCGSRDKWQNKTHILSFNPRTLRDCIILAL